MSNQIHFLYESIVEAFIREELWGVEAPSADSTQLEFNFKIHSD